MPEGWILLAASTALLALAVAGWALRRTSSRLATAVRRISDDTMLIVEANPGHRLDPTAAGPLEKAALAVNRLADRRQAAERDAAKQAQELRRDVDAERGRLAALMAQLTVAVIVCNSEGRILLYNEAARRLLGDDTAVGLGRSVFGIVDRGLLTHARERLLGGVDGVYTASTLSGPRLLRVRVTLVGEAAAPRESPDAGGYVLVLEDVTEEARAGDRSERMRRELTEGTRASLAAIRAAAESILDYPDLSEAERHGFLEIVHEEAARLGRRVDELAGDPSAAGAGRLLTEISARDLLAVVAADLAGRGLRCPDPDADDALWLRGDAHSLAAAVGHVMERVSAHSDVADLSLSLVPEGPHGRLDAVWDGEAPSVSVVARWLDQPLPGGGSATARDLADRNGAEIWCGSGDGGTAYLRVLVPVAAGTGASTRPAVASAAASATPAASLAGVRLGSRPEFYDFDLFARRDDSAHLFDQPLEQLSYTVLDTETTGLDPAGGDRILSVGAVRIVNGRVLRGETFESLVQPGRSVPAVSTAIHGITEEMLRDAPPAAEVLPRLARFAEDTVLVGHNVAFDLQFLNLAGDGPAVTFAQPALDTLLLHAALRPEHGHTLEEIAQTLGVSVVGRHTALGDALVTAEVFVALVALLKARGVQTLGEALDLTRSSYRSRAGDPASADR